MKTNKTQPQNKEINNSAPLAKNTTNQTKSQTTLNAIYSVLNQHFTRFLTFNTPAPNQLNVKTHVLGHRNTGSKQLGPELFFTRGVVPPQILPNVIRQYHKNKIECFLLRFTCTIFAFLHRITNSTGIMLKIFAELFRCISLVIEFQYLTK